MEIFLYFVGFLVVVYALTAGWVSLTLDRTEPWWLALIIPIYLPIYYLRVNGGELVAGIVFAMVLTAPVWIAFAYAGVVTLLH